MVLLAFVRTLAEPGPIPGTQRVEPAFQTADLVCNCVVESIKVVHQERVGDTPKTTLLRQDALASVLIDDEYKRTASDGARRITVEFQREIPNIRVFLPSLQEGERALMFLKKPEATSVFVFSDPYLSATPFHLLPRASHGQGLRKLEVALALTAKQGSSEDQVRAMRVLEGFDQLGPETLSAVMPLASSDDPDVALSAIAVLLKNKVVGAVPILEAYLRTHHLSHLPAAILSVGGELGGGSDGHDLNALEALTSSRILSIQWGAIFGVRKMRNPHSAKVLVGLLDNANPDVRFQAVITLSEIFRKGDDYAPDVPSFNRNPEFYVGLWKSWWATEGQVHSER
jgi:hypothetical protein